ncbi:MAG: hypothetical protein ACREQ8_12485 [Woeseiaceae bacterium]
MLLRTALLLFALALPGPSYAAGDISALPGDAIWYFHADLEQMRAVNSGSHLYAWLNGEVFDEINQDTGIDLHREVNSVTAFSDAAFGTVVVVEGPVTQASRDKILALAAADAKLDTQSYDGKTYYHVAREEGSGARHDNDSFDDLARSAYFSFAVKDKVIVASEQKQIESLLDNGGRIAGTKSHNGSLFVLTADKEFVQAGMKTAAFADDDDDWDSNILRNTERAALLVSDRNGLIAVEAQLVSREPSITQSLGGIINGLISLQAFNSDLDPELRTFIENTTVDIKGNVLAINAVFDPEIVVRIIGDDDGEENSSE